jgi:hypothetical protein
MATAWSQLHALPKVELHAHLNGSVRLSTLFELHAQLHDSSTAAAASSSISPDAYTLSRKHATAKTETTATATIRAATPATAPISARSFTIPTLDHSLSMQECFALFGMIHSVTTSVPIIRRICREVISDFAAENTR